MSEAEKQSGLGDNTLKILTIAGPLFASSLAITYDVGFFAGIGIGFFSFFSLSEHLVFALQSLPFAIPPVITLLIWITSGWYSYQQGYRDGLASSQGTNADLSRYGSVLKLSSEFLRSRLWLERLLFGLAVCFIFLELWMGLYSLAFLMSGVLIFAATGRYFIEALKSRSLVLVVTCAAATLVLSFLIGLQRADAILKSKEASEIIHVDDKSLPARLIRGGDKGVLIFSLDSKKIRFLRWDSIKQIETL